MKNYMVISVWRDNDAPLVWTKMNEVDAIEEFSGLKALLDENSVLSVTIYRDDNTGFPVMIDHARA